MPPASARISALATSGASFKPIPIAIPVDSMVDNPKNMKKIAFLDYVLCWPKETPSDIVAAIWCKVTPIMRFMNTFYSFIIPKAIPSNIE